LAEENISEHEVTKTWRQLLKGHQCFYSFHGVTVEIIPI